ncbi:hypothetical protein J5X92_20765, partial [Alteromonas sp. K632G]|uniref:hypothetical protein n=1 Tax=Alteromonas sp. K632G TaxID=2820757 RepID=UPI001AD6CD9D
LGRKHVGCSLRSDFSPHACAPYSKVRCQIVEIIPRTYQVLAVFCVVYWVIWFVPFTTVIIGTDGSWFFSVGIISLWLFPVAIIAWLFKKVRIVVVQKLGKQMAWCSFVVILAFFTWGSFLLLSLFVYGV